MNKIISALSTDETIYIYSDASFNNKFGISVMGYAVFKGDLDHESSTLTIDRIQLIQGHQKREFTNIRAELSGAIRALEASGAGGQKKLFCDCEAIVNLPQRRKKLEATQFISQSSKKTLVNADLYKEIYLLLDRDQPEIIWLKGHSSIKQANRIEKNFSVLDKAVRKQMRFLVDQI